MTQPLSKTEHKNIYLIRRECILFCCICRNVYILVVFRLRFSRFHVCVITSFVSGWHHRLNRKAGMAGLGFYRLVPLLRREAELVELAVRGGDLCRDRRNAATRLDNQLTQLWDEYMADELTTARLLRICGDLYRMR